MARGVFLPIILRGGLFYQPKEGVSASPPYQAAQGIIVAVWGTKKNARWGRDPPPEKNSFMTQAGMRPSLHGPYMGWAAHKLQWKDQKNFFSVQIWGCNSLPMNLETLVVANQDVTVNTSLGLAHTVCHVLGTHLAKGF